ncbi:MAG: hypothetical protein ACOCUF_03730 [Patescibacteria group bacterium]
MPIKRIKLDEETRIQIEANNYVLLRAKKKQNGEANGWEYEAYFPDLASLAKHYINQAPYRSKDNIKNFQELINVVRSAEDNIKKLIINKNL